MPSARLIGDIPGWETGALWYLLDEPLDGCPRIVIVHNASGIPSNQPQIPRAYVYPVTEQGAVVGPSMIPYWVSEGECSDVDALAAVGYDFDPSPPPPPPVLHIVYRVPTVAALPTDNEELGVYAIDEGAQYGLWSSGWGLGPWADARDYFGVELHDVPLHTATEENP